jgi:hypothetical protein
MVPNLYVETTCQLHRLLDSLCRRRIPQLRVPQKVTTATDGVDAIRYRHDKCPGLALATVSRCGCRPGVVAATIATSVESRLISNPNEPEPPFQTPQIVPNNLKTDTPAHRPRARDPRGDEASGDPDRELQQGPVGPTDQGRCLKVKPDAIWERPGVGALAHRLGGGSRRAL